MSRLTLLGWYGSPNLGDEAELATILARLARAPRPPAVTVFSHNPAHTRAHHGDYPGGLQVLRRNPFAPAALRAIRRSRALVLGGGGLIQDGTSIYNLPIYTSFALVARLLGRPCVWWGVGVEPLVTTLGRIQARLIVRLATDLVPLSPQPPPLDGEGESASDSSNSPPRRGEGPGERAVSVRDTESRRLLLAAGVPPARIRVTVDPAVAVGRAPWPVVRNDEEAPPENTQHATRNTQQETNPQSFPSGEPLRGFRNPQSPPVVAFCVRDLPNNPLGRGLGYLLPVAVQKRLGIGGAARAIHDQRAGEFYGLLAQAADHLIEQHGVQVQFIPFWPGRDDAIATTIQAEMRHADQSTQVTTALTPAEAAALLSSMEMVVAVRLHALIFAAAAGVPGVGFGYARKIRGFMARTEQPDAVLDTAAAWPIVRATLDRVWEERAVRRPALLARMAELQTLAEADAQRVLGWCG